MSHKTKSRHRMADNVAYTEDENERIINNAKRTAAAERIAPPVPMEYMDPQHMCRSLEFSRQEFERKLKANEKPTRQTFLGNEMSFSTRPLNELEPIYLKDILVRKRHKGRFLLCRVIGPPSRFISVSLGIEDPEGWSQSLTIYNFPGTNDAGPQELDTLFPASAIMAIREPKAKMVLTGKHSHIRIDAPSDIVFIDPNDPIMNGVTWKTGERPSPVSSLSPEHWKSVGDAHFKTKQFAAAATAYSYALRRNPLFTSIRLNRCLANLRLSHFVAALHDTSILLKDESLGESDKIKALYRTGLANYGIENYAEALKYYELCLSIDPNLKDASLGIEKCHNRMREQAEGVYDWKEIYLQCQKPGSRLDVADYVGPIQVICVPKRGGGRGIVATEDIKAGTILVACKAFATVHIQDEIRRGRVMAMNFVTGTTNMGTHYSTIQEAVSHIAAGDHRYKQILDLYPGPGFGKAELVTSDSSNKTTDIADPTTFAGDIDIARVEGIVIFNSFALPLQGTSSSQPDDDEDKSTALYYLPSFFNHSCIPTAQRKFYGDFIVVRSSRDIAAGEEITISYCGVRESYKQRTKRLQMHFKECDCNLCVFERGLKSEFHQYQEDKFLEVDSFRNAPLNQVRKRIKQIISHYPTSYPQLRLLSCKYHFLLASRLTDVARREPSRGTCATLYREAVQSEITALEAFCVRVVDKEIEEPQNAMKEVRLPVSLDHLPYDAGEGIVGCLMVFGTFLKLDAKWRAEMWLRAAIEFDNLAFGGGIPIFRLRYANILQVYEPQSWSLLAEIDGTQ